MRAFVAHLKSMRPFFKESIDIVEDFSNKAFEEGGRPKKWKPLAPSTEKARERRWGYYKKTPNNPKTLRWTGNLQDNNQKQATERFGAFRKKAKYAKYHQRGGKNLPQRKILTLDPQAAANIVKALQKKIDRDIGMSGLQV